MSNIVIDPSFLGTVGFGGIIGFLIGYALKKIAKILAVIVGVFFAAILYFESNGIININWDKLQSIAQSTVILIHRFDNYSCQMVIVQLSCQ